MHFTAYRSSLMKVWEALLLIPSLKSTAKPISKLCLIQDAIMITDIQEMGTPSFSDPCSLPGWHKQCRRGGWVESIRISSKSTRWQNYWHHAFYCISEQPYESLRSIITYSLPKKYSKAYIKGPLSRRFKWNKRTFYFRDISRHIRNCQTFLYFHC